MLFLLTLDGSRLLSVVDFSLSLRDFGRFPKLLRRLAKNQAWERRLIHGNGIEGCEIWIMVVSH